MDLILNPRLQVLLARSWLTPYIAYERVRQCLAPYFVAIKSVQFKSDEAGKIVLPLIPRLKPNEIEYLHFSFKREPNLGDYIVDAKITNEATITEEAEIEFNEWLNEISGTTKSSYLKKAFKSALSKRVLAGDQWDYDAKKALELDRKAGQRSKIANKLSKKMNEAVSPGLASKYLKTPILRASWQDNTKKGKKVLDKNRRVIKKDTLPDSSGARGFVGNYAL